CLVCARSLGIKPVDDILKKMGMNDEDIANMSEEIDGMIDGAAAEQVNIPWILQRILRSNTACPPWRT
ncbi:MAG: hypothetical protein IJ012_06935, partial [Clostridia bacterium]|nr:hypothetical protein [Clostridia bacterium]